MISVIGQNIKRIRTIKDISAYELSKKSGVSSATISQIESGKRATLKGDTLAKVAHSLGVQPGDLLGEDETLNFETDNVLDLLNIFNIADGLILDNSPLTPKEKQLINLSISMAISSVRYDRLK